MANSSTPNSTPATGRTSTTSSRRSKKQNSVAALLTGVFGLVKADPPRALRFFSAGRWTFSFLRRVKGAWWPSRSSKPSSPRKWRRRFDSYPLRLDGSTFNAQRSTLNVQLRQLGVERWTMDVERFLLLNLKGGDVDVARADP